MGLNVENSIRFNHVATDVYHLAELLNQELGEGSAFASAEEGNEEDPSALIFLDIPSFMSFNETEKRIYEEALKESDAINFFCLPDEWIRLTFAIKDYWEREEEPYETNVIELVKK